MEGLDNHQHNISLPSESTPPIWKSRRSLSDFPEFSPADSDELRFTLKELFLAISIAAVLLALFRSLGIFGAVFSFLSAVIATLLIFPYLFPQGHPRQRLYFDFVWGIVMPIVCLIFDPLVFKHPEYIYELSWFRIFDTPAIAAEIHIHPAAYFAWPMLAGQIVTLSLVLAWGKSLRPIAPTVAGILAAGWAISLCLGAILSLPAALGTLLFGIGLLGFTPIFTCRTYFRRMRLMWFVARGERSHEWQVALAALGVVLWLVITLAIGTIVLIAAPPPKTDHS